MRVVDLTVGDTRYAEIGPNAWDSWGREEIADQHPRRRQRAVCENEQGRPGLSYGIVGVVLRFCAEVSVFTQGVFPGGPGKQKGGTD